MEHIKHQIDWKICIDCGELYEFIANNSDKTHNQICEIANEAYLFEEYSGRIGHLQYMVDKDVYNPTENNLFFQKMANGFFEAYNIDKSKLITVLFTD